MPRVYVAGPLFNTHERWYLERIAEALESAGYETFLPHRDAGLIDLQSRDPCHHWWASVARRHSAAGSGCHLWGRYAVRDADISPCGAGLA